MTAPGNKHAGRSCRVCRKPLTDDNSHCAFRDCPWCDGCVQKRRDEGEANRR